MCELILDASSKLILTIYNNDLRLDFSKNYSHIDYTKNKLTFNNLIQRYRDRRKPNESDQMDKLIILLDEVYNNTNNKNNITKYESIFFLREIVVAFKEMTFKFYRKPKLLQDLTLIYWSLAKDDYRKKIYVLKNQKVYGGNVLFYIDAGEHYLDLCMNDDNQDWFDLHDPKLNREKQVEDIANFLIDLKQSGRYQGNDKLDLLIQKARTWIMLRYDIDKAAYYQFFNHRFWLDVFKVLPEVCGFLILFSLATISLPFWQLVKPPELYIFNDYAINNFALLALYGILLAEGIMIVKKIKSGKEQTQVFMPRIVGGIIVGYFALLGEEMWFGLYQKTLHGQFNWIIFLGRIIIPLAAIYIYLLIEMSNVKGIEDIKIKALRILGRGYAYSLMVGVIFSDIFGKTFIDIVFHRLSSINGLNEFSAVHFKGIFGNIYPEPILLLSPLALFIGVFIQLLWEDKAVTAKI